jgi:hypothetical protein
MSALSPSIRHGVLLVISYFSLDPLTGASVQVQVDPQSPVRHNVRKIFDHDIMASVF